MNPVIRAVAAGVVAAAIGVVTGRAMAASLTVANPGFESPGIAGFNYAWGTTPDGWNAATGPLNGNYSAAFTRVGMFSFGPQVAQMQVWNGYATLSQTLPYTVAPNTVYTLSLDAGPWVGYQGNGGTYFFQLLGGGTPLLTITGQVDSLAVTGFDGATWGTHGTRVTGTSLQTPEWAAAEPLTIVLRLEPVDGNGNGMVIGMDNVAVGATVPEPAVLGLVGASSVGLLVRRRQK